MNIEQAVKTVEKYGRYMGGGIYMVEYKGETVTARDTAVLRDRLLERFNNKGKGAS